MLFYWLFNGDGDLDKLLILKMHQTRIRIVLAFAFYLVHCPAATMLAFKEIKKKSTQKLEKDGLLGRRLLLS